jgi:hypothetical protein
MVDRSRDLRLVRGGRTRLSSANPRAEAAQDLLVAPRLLRLSAETYPKCHSQVWTLVSCNIYCNPPPLFPPIPCEM